MVKVGHANYLSLNHVTRFNRTANDNRYLKDFMSYLEEELDIDETKHKVARRKPWIGNQDLKNGLLISATLESEIYYTFQTQLRQMTGKYWPMDKVIDLLIHWFIFTYSNPKNISEIKPFEPNYGKGRLKLKRRFDECFSRFYKNIMGSWSENLK
jgi:hypothetical protein